MTITIEELVKHHLIHVDYDGLYNMEYKCFCKLPHILQCGKDVCLCKPGYKFYDENNKFIGIKGYFKIKGAKDG